MQRNYENCKFVDKSAEDREKIYIYLRLNPKACVSPNVKKFKHWCIGPLQHRETAEKSQEAIRSAILNQQTVQSTAQRKEIFDLVRLLASPLLGVKITEVGTKLELEITDFALALSSVRRSDAVGRLEALRLD
jgi:hypothetical protein